MRPEELGFAVEAMHAVVDGLPAYYIVHACFGAFETIYPGLLDLPVDNLDLAISHSACRATAYRVSRPPKLWPTRWAPWTPSAPEACARSCAVAASSLARAGRSVPKDA